MKKKTTKDLFQRLIILTIKMASSINKHSHTAIYTIDPKINSFVLQGGKKMSSRSQYLSKTGIY